MTARAAAPRPGIDYGVIRFGGIGALPAFLAVAAWLAAATGPAVGQAPPDDVYTVSGVRVDETAGTAAEARGQALADGHRAAFDRLARRLVPRAGLARLPAPDAPRLSELARSFGIDEEKTSDVRYLARLVFRFRADDVRRYLRAAGVAFAETRSKPVLVLPVWEDAGALLLWDRPNPWLEAWASLPRPDGLVPLRLPQGGFADIRDISAEQAAGGDAARLDAVGGRYGVDAVIVARAGIRTDAGSGVRSVEVAAAWFGGALDGQAAAWRFRFADGEARAPAIARAAAGAADAIEEDWKGRNLVRFDRPAEIVARIALGGLRDWVGIRARLRSVLLLRSVGLVSVTRREAKVRLGFWGDGAQLRVALAQRGLDLSGAAERWMLRAAPRRAKDPRRR